MSILVSPGQVTGPSQGESSGGAATLMPLDERTQDDRGRDGGTNFTLRMKEQETRLTIHEHDDDDDDDDDDESKVSPSM